MGILKGDTMSLDYGLHSRYNVGTYRTEVLASPCPPPQAYRLVLAGQQSSQGCQKFTAPFRARSFA